MGRTYYPRREADSKRVTELHIVRLTDEKIEKLTEWQTTLPTLDLMDLADGARRRAKPAAKDTPHRLEERAEAVKTTEFYEYLLARRAGKIS